MNNKKGLHPINPILIVDDEVHTLNSVELTLRSSGYDSIILCQESKKAISILKNQKIELILLDILMPGLSGEKILAQAVRDYPEIPVIMVTGINEVDTAVKCMLRGAFDYVLKPVKKNRLLSAVKKAVDVRQLRRENINLTRRFFSESLEHPEKFKKIITRSRKIQTIFQYCEAVAYGNHPILITGETGVGKELIAEAIHFSSKRDGDFVAVDIAGLDDNVVSDTLFGHIKGAFTGANKYRKGIIEKAESGTLFLDEIGDLRSASQMKLLRLLDKNEYFPIGSDVSKTAHVRFLFATHKDLESMKEKKVFRDDLYYRLHTHHVHIPPLRERIDDVPILFDHFLEVACKDFNKKKPSYHPGLISLLKSYHYPGNVRELKAMIFDAVGRNKSNVLSSESFINVIKTRRKGVPATSATTDSLGDSWVDRLDNLPTLKEASQALIKAAMKRANSNQRIAALMLGITPQALGQRLKKTSGRFHSLNK